MTSMATATLTSRISAYFSLHTKSTTMVTSMEMAIPISPTSASCSPTTSAEPEPSAVLPAEELARLDYRLTPSPRATPWLRSPDRAEPLHNPCPGLG